MDYLDSSGSAITESLMIVQVMDRDPFSSLTENINNQDFWFTIGNPHRTDPFNNVLGFEGFLKYFQFGYGVISNDYMFKSGCSATDIDVLLLQNYWEYLPFSSSPVKCGTQNLQLLNSDLEL